jgi:hypothetical protein
MVDTSPVRDASRQLDARRLNLLTWQTAGVGVAAPRAWVRAFLSATPANMVVLAHGEAWNPDGLSDPPYYAPPALTRIGAGDYRVTWPSTVLDLDGLEVPFVIEGMLATPSQAVFVAVQFDGQVNRRLLRVRTNSLATFDEVEVTLAVF